VRIDMEFMNRLFHAALRRDLERAIGSLTASRHPSPAQRAALAEHVGLVLDLLHHHHIDEDIGLWPLVRRRAPDLGTQLDIMEAEHASVAGAIISTRAAARRQYAATADPSAAHDLRQALVELSGVLLPHLEHEETEVMPRVVRALTDRDRSALSRQQVPSRGSFALAGTRLVWIADGMNQAERAMFNQQVSPTFQWLVDRRYGPVYRRRTALAFQT
jgi:Hemerythrin HHE cation binding domain